MRKFMVYMEDRDYVFKCAIPAKNETKAREYVQGNGDVIAIKDVTDDHPISADKVAQALEASGFGKTEIDIITRTLQWADIAD